MSDSAIQANGFSVRLFFSGPASAAKRFSGNSPRPPQRGAGGASCKFSEDSVRSACSSAVSSTLSDDISSFYGKITEINESIHELSSQIEVIGGGAGVFDYGSQLTWSFSSNKTTLSSGKFPFDARVQGDTVGYANNLALNIDGVVISGGMLSRNIVSAFYSGSSWSQVIHWQADVPAGVNFQLSRVKSVNVVPFRYGKKLSDGDMVYVEPLSGVFKSGTLADFVEAVEASSPLCAGYTSVSSSLPWSNGDWSTSLTQKKESSSRYSWKAVMRVVLKAKKRAMVSFSNNQSAIISSQQASPYTYPAYKYAVGTSSSATPSASAAANSTIIVPSGSYLILQACLDQDVDSKTNRVGNVRPDWLFSNVTVSDAESFAEIAP